MAKAEFKTPAVEREVVLTMTESEAKTLRTILGNTSITTNQTLKLEGIFKALRDADVARIVEDKNIWRWRIQSDPE